jgi:gas vesicle protein
MSDPILQLLMDIKGDVGELKASTQTFADGLKKHIEDDEKLAEDVKTLQLTQAANKGAARVWTLVGSGIGAAVGSAAAIAAAWIQAKH